MIPGFPRDVVLSTGPLGGLGDALVYTTLPERFAAEGHRVLFFAQEDADGNQLGNIARNDEILQLLWYNNPHLSGLSDVNPTIGHPRQGAFYDMCNILPSGSAIEAMERAHGLPPPYSKAPRIYYQPKPYHRPLDKAVLLDMAALSSVIGERGWQLFHQKMVDRFGTNCIHHVTFPQSVNHNQIQLPEGAWTLEVESIFQYVDMLASCRAWIGSEAGGQALAAAVRGEHDQYEVDVRPEIVCLIAPGTYNSGSYAFRGVTYRTSKYADGDDYLHAAEVPMWRYATECRATVLKKWVEWRTGKGLPV